MRLCVGASQESQRLSVGASQVGQTGLAKGHKKRLNKKDWKMKTWWFK